MLVPGGRGVFLMKRLVDEIEYNDCGNCVRMTIHPTASAASAPRADGLFSAGTAPRLRRGMRLQRPPF